MSILAKCDIRGCHVYRITRLSQCTHKTAKTCFSSFRGKMAKSQKNAFLTKTKRCDRAKTQTRYSRRSKTRFSCFLSKFSARKNENRVLRHRVSDLRHGWIGVSMNMDFKTGKVGKMMSGKTWWSVLSSLRESQTAWSRVLMTTCAHFYSKFYVFFEFFAIFDSFDVGCVKQAVILTSTAISISYRISVKTLKFCNFYKFL